MNPTDIARMSAVQYAELLDTLNDVREFLDNYVDVVDGSYGEPRPNRAMSLDSRVAQLIESLERE